MVRRVVPGVLCLAFATSAEAAPGELFGHEVLETPALSAAEAVERREGFQQMLEKNNWVQIDDQVRPAAANGAFAQPPADPQLGSFPPHRSTIFLNFFGQEGMTPGNNAALNQSNCFNGETDWPGFMGSEAQALALIDVFEINMEPYGVRFAYEEAPPAHLPYAMVMMGGTPDLLGLGGGVLGVSCSSDCADRWWRDTTFAFTGAINPNNAAVLGTTALHEAAHAFGLAHIGDPSRIMNPFVGSGVVTWADSCTPYDDATGGINCQPTHAQYCDGNPAQNTNAELLAYFGENSPDVIPPTVNITFPEDGATFAPGEEILVEVEVDDDHDGFGWQLVIPELDQAVQAYAFERSWTIGFPEGEYTVRVEAIDHERNEGFDEVTIFVGGAGEDDSGLDESGDGDGSGDDGSGDDGEGSGDEAGLDGTGDDASALDDGGDESGCNCTTDQTPPLGWMVLGLMPLALLRRRD